MGGPFRKERDRTEERREDGQCGRPRNFWALQWWYLEAGEMLAPKLRSRESRIIASRAGCFFGLGSK